MGQGHRLSRREILDSICALGSGSLLLPLSALQGERQSTQAPAVIRGALRDGATGRPIAAKIRVTNRWSGEAFLPAPAIKTMPGADTTPRQAFLRYSETSTRSLITDWYSTWVSCSIVRQRLPSFSIM